MNKLQVELAKFEKRVLKVARGRFPDATDVHFSITVDAVHIHVYINNEHIHMYGGYYTTNVNEIVQMMRTEV